MKQKNVYFKQTRIVEPQFLFLFFLLIIFANSTIKSQGLTDKCFKNSFGSHALITQHNTETGNFEGFYASSTGSVGVYRIIGKTPAEPSLDTYFPVTFTIGWGTLKNKPNDPSQYWSSSMTGNYYPHKKKLNLLNVISAPGPFDAVSIFNPGNLPQSQSFTTFPRDSCNYFPHKAPIEPSGQGSSKDQQYKNLLLGEWKVDPQNSYGLISKLVITGITPRGNSFPEIRYYEVVGNFSLSTGENIPFTGIASPYIRKKKETDFSFAISLVGTVEKTKAQPTTYNISLSGFSSGDSSQSINMFLTKSKEEESIYRIETNEISTGEIFKKTIK
ncbi:MAG: hypothetical protein P8L21_02245 [Polaribacter sp.]|jgi:hypothetical protein|nr:hypothetical protein [Polaribacter sp.]MDG2357085.1 hypothetical protein [Polaribacter sp.]